MKRTWVISAGLMVLIYLLAFSGCQNKIDNTQNAVHTPVPTAEPVSTPQPEAPPAPRIPNLQAEITDDRNKNTEAPIGRYDFRNHTYPLPRGWQGAGVDELKIENGVAPASQEDKQIGLTYVTTKYLDATGDGQEDALVVLKIATGGSAIPQVVYIYEWKSNAPELIWYFRTGDRADGGLKDLRIENGELLIELFGQDRFILGEAETGKVTGDEEQLCCPTFFTRTAYKWNGKNFQMQRKRLTFSVEDPGASPVENMADKVNQPPAKGKSGSK